MSPPQKSNAPQPFSTLLSAPNYPLRAAHKSIEATFTYTAAELRIRIRNDGVGLDAAVGESGMRPGHWGLKGMRERAEKIGATLQMWSRTGAGTEIDVTIPGSVAYQLNPAATWWRRLGFVSP